MTRPRKQQYVCPWYQMKGWWVEEKRQSLESYLGYPTGMISNKTTDLYYPETFRKHMTEPLGGSKIQP